ncbi:MAG: DUF2799 domain-containing protein [Gammaproteobacteria bacterium]|nr:DUF2799 domain-containing protein [Gammaproteobacteria bacterium]
MKIRLVICMSAAVAISGCVAMSEEECRSADWRTVGYEDGARGIQRISDYRQACAKAGVVPDLDAYLHGLDEGLAVYCRPARGYRTGRSGRLYGGVCPEDLEPGFLDAYSVGRRVHAAEVEAAGWRRTVGNLDEQIAKAEEAIDELEWQLDNADLTTEQRRATRADIYELLAETIPWLREERREAISSLRYALDRFEAMLDNPYER